MFRLLYNFGKVEGGARGESFQKAKMETVAEALKPESADVFRKESPVADSGLRSTKGLEGLRAFNSPHQFCSSSLEMRTWRQENGSIYQQLGSSACCLVELGERIPPTSVLPVKC